MRQMSPHTSQQISDLKIFPERFGELLKTLWRATCDPLAANCPPLLYSQKHFPFPVKSLLNKGQRWHSTADHQHCWSDSSKFILPVHSKSDEKNLHEITVNNQG